MPDTPNYTKKPIITNGDTAVLYRTLDLRKGQSARFFQTQASIFDVSDDGTAGVKLDGVFLLCIVGDFTASYKNGHYEIFAFLAPDNTPVRVWEQHYKRDQLHGRWNQYNLNGTLVRFETFDHGKVSGLTRDYHIDGKTISAETEYKGTRHMERVYSPEGALIQERPFDNGLLNGIGYRYYTDGNVMESAELVNGELHGLYTYYHPNGKPWIKVRHRDNKPWEAMASYHVNGESRPAGTLKNGNGTLIQYRPDGTVEKTVNYQAGVATQ